jgi:hypothetical protein
MSSKNTTQSSQLKLATLISKSILAYIVNKSKNGDASGNVSVKLITIAIGSSALSAYLCEAIVQPKEYHKYIKLFAETSMKLTNIIEDDIIVRAINELNKSLTS